AAGSAATTPASTGIKEVEQFFGVRIANANVLCAQWCQFFQLPVGLDLQTLALGDFGGWSNQHDIAIDPLVEALGLQDDIQRLVPGYILQSQSDVSCHRITGHQIEIREVGNQLQQCPHFYVLE